MCINHILEPTKRSKLLISHCVKVTIYLERWWALLLARCVYSHHVEAKSILSFASECKVVGGVAATLILWGSRPAAWDQKAFFWTHSFCQAVFGIEFLLCKLDHTYYQSNLYLMCLSGLQWPKAWIQKLIRHYVIHMVITFVPYKTDVCLLPDPQGMLGPGFA